MNINWRKACFSILFSISYLVVIVPTLIVRTNNSSVSLNNYLTDPQPHFMDNVELGQETKDKLVKPKHPPIVLGWTAGSDFNRTQLQNYQGLTTVSTALSTVDNNFELKVTNEHAIRDVVHEQGKIFWTRLVMNKDTKSNVHSFLINAVRRHTLIKQLQQATVNQNWDGVNIDIENVNREDRELFSKFIIELSTALHQSHVTVSIDLPPDSSSLNDKSPFNHQVLGNYCDFVVFMGYDQHWSTDPTPGPVSSKPWIEDSIMEFLKTGIPSQKLILGLPSYTRIWQQDTAGHIIRNPAFSIKYVENWLSSNHRPLTWNSSLGEYYSSFTYRNLQYKVWLTNRRSLENYLLLVKKYDLGGSAIWTLNLMDSNYWNSINFKSM